MVSGLVLPFQFILFSTSLIVSGENAQDLRFPLTRTWSLKLVNWFLKLVNPRTMDLTSCHSDSVKWSGSASTEICCGNSIGVRVAMVDPPKVWTEYRFSWLESGIEVRKLSARCTEKILEATIIMTDITTKCVVNCLGSL